MIKKKNGRATMKEDRRKQMGAIIAQKQSMTMEQLCEHFGVSMNTIRADVAYLVKTGAVEKIYGGVRAAEHKQVPLFASRALENTAQKKRIAQRAQALIEDHDIIFIDAGTTTMHLIDCLEHCKHVTIVTASLYVIQQAAALENVTLIVLPGTANHRTNSLADVGTLEYLSRYRFTKAFMGVSGVTPDGRLNVSTYIEYEIKRAALKQSQQAYLLVDTAKFGSSGLMSYGQVADLTAMITDHSCPDFVRSLCQESQIPLIEV